MTTVIGHVKNMTGEGANCAPVKAWEDPAGHGVHPLPLEMQDPRITNGIPEAMEGEYFVLARDGIKFSASSGRTKLSASGTLYLSTLRMVVVCNQGSSFNGFDMPLATMQNERFNQPIFGANNMTGSNPPLDGSGFEGDIKWTIYFNHGGVGTFLPFFFRLLQTCACSSSSSSHGCRNEHGRCPVDGSGAFVDPSDPTRLYVPEAKGSGA